MTDREITETIAEFLGWTIVGDGSLTKHSDVIKEQVYANWTDFGYFDRVEHLIPAWKKLWESNGSEFTNALGSLCYRELCKSVEAHVNCGWLKATARQQAECLAKWIKKADSELRKLNFRLIGAKK